jgi:16S rRNA pseudouridine516 synthase
VRRVRLDRLIAQNGYTRREARALISRGMITVDGVPAANGAVIIDPAVNVAAVNGRGLRADEHLYIMLNKPAGCLTATVDSRETTVLDLIVGELRRPGLAPAGRLDKDVTGLVLMTTDGQLTHRIISPKWNQAKRYLAEVEGRLTVEIASRFKQGLELCSYKTLPAELEIIDAGEVSRCRVTLREGKYHQVKRMFMAVGHPVKALHREAISSLALDGALKPGDSRLLTNEEIVALRASVSLGTNAFS